MMAHTQAETWSPHMYSYLGKTQNCTAASALAKASEVKRMDEGFLAPAGVSDSDPRKEKNVESACTENGNSRHSRRHPN